MARNLLYLKQKLETKNIPIDPRLFYRSGLPKAYAVADYDKQLAELLSEFKRSGDRRQIEGLCRALAELIRVQHPKVDWLLVPIPSSARATRQRGFVPAEVIAKLLVKSLGASSKVVRGLWQQSFIADQAGLTVEARENNLRGGLRAAPSLRRHKKLAVAIVDDVVTTGATAREGVRALAEQGIVVVALFALGETLRKDVRRT